METPLVTPIAVKKRRGKEKKNPTCPNFFPHGIAIAHKWIKDI